MLIAEVDCIILFDVANVNIFKLNILQCEFYCKCSFKCIIVHACAWVVQTNWLDPCHALQTISTSMIDKRSYNTTGYNLRLHHPCLCCTYMSESVDLLAKQNHVDDLQPSDFGRHQICRHDFTWYPPYYRERERKSDNTAPLFEFRILDQHLATQPKWLDLPSQLNRVNVGTTQWNLSSQRLCTVSQIDRLTPCHLVGGWSHPSGGVDRMPESQHLSSSLSSSYW